MLKYLFLSAMLLCGATYAQYSVKGKIEPGQDYSWILLYKLENGSQTYVDNADVVDGKFEFKIGESEPAGIYRAYYQLENNLFVEFIYNKEEVAFSFHPENPSGSISFSQSEENSIYQEHYSTVSSLQRGIDSLQVLFFRTEDPAQEAEIRKNYQELLAEQKSKQAYFENISKGKIANHFIRASAQFNAPLPVKLPEEYIKGIKSHYFDAIDVNDRLLSHSTFINDRLIDYVFYLHQADNPESQNQLQQEAIAESVAWIGDDYDILKNFEESLLEEYRLQENVPMIYYVVDNYYNKLPAQYQDDALKEKVVATLKTAVGLQAPDISWDMDGESQSLTGLTGYDYYVVVFFSSGCGHCQTEMPQFYQFISGIENIQVLAIGLEDDREQWESMAGGYHEFINVIDLEKWSSQRVKDYGVQGIPSYFILDKDKKILAKPQDFDELRSLFEAR